MVVLGGEAGLASNLVCHLKFLPRDKKITKGMFIVSSGFSGDKSGAEVGSGIIPGGLKIGHVVSVSKGELNQQATVELSASLNDFKFVTIIKPVKKMKTMKVVCFVAVCLFIGLWAELSISSAGLILPLLMVEVFYVTVLKKWKWGVISAFLLCHTLDSLTGYVSLPGMLLVVMMASFWRGIGDCSRLELQIIPIFICLCAAVSVMFILTHFKYGGFIAWGQVLVNFLVAVFGTSLISPLIIGIQDRVANALKIPTYTDIQHEELYSASDN